MSQHGQSGVVLLLESADVALARVADTRWRGWCRCRCFRCSCIRCSVRWRRSAKTEPRCDRAKELAPERIGRSRCGDARRRRSDVCVAAGDCWPGCGCGCGFVRLRLQEGGGAEPPRLVEAPVSGGARTLAWARGSGGGDVLVHAARGEARRLDGQFAPARKGLGLQGDELCRGGAKQQQYTCAWSGHAEHKSER
eukprot:6213775-Pleurochrysis_carterae.AAC.6